ncbi:glycosyltransferase [Kineococcus sp. NPDC059986]|uniref:glycosyltransferase n=1 Tax=Kineococcus sp. NPDC059986 TaxID=3155538 RepID=UPI003450F3F7
MVSLLRASPGRRAFIVRGTSGLSEGYRDLIAAGILRRVHPKARVVVSDATIEPGSAALAARLPSTVTRWVEQASKALVRFADGPGVVWCVLSRDEVTTFVRAWGVRRGTVRFTPFSHTLFTLPSPDEVHVGDHVFAGGNSLRDYDLLVEALKDLPVRVDVATSWVPAASPGNMTFESTSHEEFMRRLYGCSVLVVPMRQAARSTGQATYLNGMALGKVVIVNEVPGVRDYIDHDVTGLIVTTADEMRAAVLDVLDPSRAEHYARMRAAAQAAVRDRLSPDRYLDRLLDVALEQEE